MCATSIDSRSQRCPLVDSALPGAIRKRHAASATLRVTAGSSNSRRAIRHSALGFSGSMIARYNMNATDCIIERRQPNAGPCSDSSKTASSSGTTASVATNGAQAHHSQTIPIRGKIPSRPVATLGLSREYLRALRAAEMAAWEDPTLKHEQALSKQQRATSPLEHSANEKSQVGNRRLLFTVLGLCVAAAMGGCLLFTAFRLLLENMMVLFQRTIW